MHLSDFLAHLDSVKPTADYNMARCPGHNDAKASLSIRSGDDGRILLKCHAGCPPGQIVEAMGLKMIDLFPDRPERQLNGRRIVATYDYHDENGILLYQSVRYSPKGFNQRRPDGKGGWVYDLKTVRSVPYRLPELIAGIAAKRTIFVVEGEKDADNLAALELVATSSPMGAGKFKAEYAKWFKGANVAIIPDNDEPGEAHALDVARKLHKAANSIWILRLPDLPPKGDVSDWLENGGTKEQLADIFSDMTTWEPTAAPTPKPSTPADDSDLKNAPFRCLGFQGEYNYYLPYERKQVIALTAEKHKQSSLLLLAPVSYWETYFPGRQGADWMAASNRLQRLSGKVGPYDIRRRRGRGAWLDDGHIVLHLGDRLIVDGLATGLEGADSRYIYEAASPTEPFAAADPLPKGDAVQLLRLTEKLAWENALSAKYLAGWTFLAPICGALAWRPHIWITGSAGTGKSWIVEHMVRPILGHASLVVVGNTSEAGIRQGLGYDAFPVVFDEAEGEDRNSQQRIKMVLDLMRAASSEAESVIIKGSSNGGKPSQFFIRSMFVLSSIGVAIEQKADASRCTVLSLSQRDPWENKLRFAEIRLAVDATLSPKYCARMRARAIAMIPMIRRNAEIFASVVGEKMGERRAGDQLGTLLAGAWALVSDDAISEEAAMAWADLHAQELRTEYGADDDDERRCLSTILQHCIPGADDGRSQLRPVVELLAIVSGEPGVEGNGINSDEAERALKRAGIKIEDDNIVISTAHAAIRNILHDTPWERGWARILKRLQGSADVSATRFNEGMKTRAVSIPIDVVFGKDE